MVEPLLSPAAWVVLGLLALLALVFAGLALFARHTARKVERALPPGGHFREIDGHLLHYVDSADDDPAARDKPTVVLVHGLGAQMQHLTHSLMERLTDEFRVVALDRPGAGWSVRARRSSHSLFDQAAVVTNFIRSLGSDANEPRPVLVGHSLGGAVAVCAALDHRAAYSGFVLLAPATHRGELPAIFEGVNIVSPAKRRLAAWTVATPMLIRNGEAMQREGFAPEEPPADFATRGGGLLGLRPGAFQTTSADLIAAGDDLPRMEARYDELRGAPVAVVHGAEDTIVPTEANGVRFAERVGAPIELIEGAGHMIPVTQADRVAEFVARHVREWTAPRARERGGAQAEAV